MTPSPSPQDVTSALVGNRRAHQLLRLVDLGDTAAVDQFLEKVVDLPAGAWIDATLDSVWRVSKKGFDGMPDGLRKRWQILEAIDYPRAHRGPGVYNEAAGRRYLNDKAHAVVDLLTAVWSDQQVRITFYESSARTSFDSEEPGSHIRRKVFGDAAER